MRSLREAFSSGNASGTLRTENQSCTYKRTISRAGVMRKLSWGCPKTSGRCPNIWRSKIAAPARLRPKAALTDFVRAHQQWRKNGSEKTACEYASPHLVNLKQLHARADRL